MKLPPIRLSALALVLVFAFAVRLYGISLQPLDWHAFRQADTASVTREYVKHGIDLLRPRYHDVSNIQSGKDNPEGYRMVEFPILNAFVASIVTVVPELPIEGTHRMLSIFFSLGSIIALFAIVVPISGYRVALASAAALAFMPFSIYYSRVILPEPAMVFFMLSGLWAFQQWLLSKSWPMLLISLLATTLALLLKPFVGFFALVYLALVIVHRRKDAWKLTPILFAYGILALLPLWWWRTWIEQFPSGIPGNTWLFNSDGIRFRPAWWRWLGYERGVKLMLGYAGVALAAYSWLSLSVREKWVYGTWALGSFLYLAIIATGNVRHDYYQALLLPFVAIVLGRGAVLLHSYLAKKMLPLAASSIVFGISVLAVTLSWMQVKEYYKVHHWNYITAGEAVRRLTDEDALIIANANGDTMLLYQTHRRGWPIGFSIDKKIEMGATHYLTTSYDDEARELESQYFTVEKTPDYLLLDLQRSHLE